MKQENETEMKRAETGEAGPPAEGAKDLTPGAKGQCVEGRTMSSSLRRFAILSALLALAYGWVLVPLVVYASGKDLHSHILLIPFVSAYLIYGDRRKLADLPRPSLGGAGIFALLGLGSLVAALVFGTGNAALSRNDFLGLATFSFLSFLVAVGFIILGKQGMRAFAFPFAFLVFMIPLPDTAVVAFERFLMAASAEAVDLFFSLAHLPYLRDGQVFQIPGITLEVAQECSGIRSSWVLFITSLLASYLFLRGPWKRTLLVSLVIPLGILRNGFRVLVLGMLCVHYGPHMIDSAIHHRGGPLFFALSLIPLFILLWWLRRIENQATSPDNPKAGESH